MLKVPKTHNSVADQSEAGPEDSLESELEATSELDSELELELEEELKLKLDSLHLRASLQGTEGT